MTPSSASPGPSTAVPATVPAVGRKVAAFTAQATGRPVRLADLKGRTVVLYFYPKDNTPGCTTETSEFAASHAAFEAAGATVLGVSRDGLPSHEKFKGKLGLPFELISDPDETLCRQFDVIRMKNMYGRQVLGVERSTFVIDGAGKLLREWRKVKVAGHVAEVLEFVQGL